MSRSRGAVPAESSEWVQALFFFVCFGPRSGLRCGGILWSDNSFHVTSSRCVCVWVCECALVLCLCAFYRCSLGRAQGVQTVAMGGRDPQWPLAQLEGSHLPCEGAPSRPGSARCSRQWELLLAEAWCRRRRWQSLTHHWQRPRRHTLHRAESKLSDFAFWDCSEEKKADSFSSGDIRAEKHRHRTRALCNCNILTLITFEFKVVL